MDKRSLLFVLIYLSSFPAFAQYPQNAFCHPLDIPLELAGSFGEVRSNHLHSGLDLRTNGKEGYNVFAVGDGHVARIKVSASGYGKALYIRHSNGFTSVYAHLREYNGTIEEYVKKKQYEGETFEIDLSLSSHEIRVRKGEIIGISGNTGGSDSPHLHFEIRDSDTEEIINPFLFGYRVRDTVPPEILSVSVYPHRNSSVNSKTVTQVIPVLKKNGRYEAEAPIKVDGSVSFGLECFDTGNKTDNRNGIYSLEVSVDKRNVFKMRFLRFGFPQTRFVNSLIDYEARIRDKRTVYRTHVLPNNRLPFPELNENKGIYRFNDENIHEVTFVAEDLSGNRSELRLKIQSVKEKIHPLYQIKPDPVAVFPYSKENTYTREDVSVKIPPLALYDTLNFEYRKGEIPVRGALSPTYSIHNPYTPLQLAYQLSIRPLNLPPALREKALIVLLQNGNTISQGGKWENGFISTRTKTFGDFAIMADTTAPVILPLNIRDDADLSKEAAIRLKIRDELSGIRTYRGTIDKAWVLMEYDQKTQTLTYRFDKRIRSGLHLFELTVTDEKNNQSKYMARFNR
jgi:murein DD-endopeptidase MepM/ murein hydrolase activator NlpD